MKRILAILDEDISYASELASLANEKELTPFSAIAFSDIENLKNYSLRQPIELLLCGMDIPDEDKDKLNAAQIMYLAEEGRRFPLREENGPERRLPPCIGKYQSGGDILREVMEFYKCREGTSYEDGLKSEIIAVCSPVGRCQKTGFAITLGQVLSEDLKVIYLNLEETSGLGVLTGTVYKRTLSDLIYAQRQGNLDESVLESAVYKLGRLSYIAPVPCSIDMAEIKAEELALLIERLAVNEHYDVLILDPGNLGNNAFLLLGRCSVIYAPVMDDEVSEAKVEEWKKQLFAYGGEELTDRVRLLHLPAPAPGGGMPNHFDALLYGEMGKMVRELLGDG